MTVIEAPEWADFRPSRLEAARRRVVESHPNTAEKLRAAPGSRLQELKEKIEEREGREGALRSLAHELRGADLRGLARQLGPWESLRAAIATVLDERPLCSILPHLWDTWHRYPGVDVVQRLLRDTADECGWEQVAGDHGATVEAWLRADDSVGAIQAWLDGEGFTYSDLGAISGQPIDVETPLARAVRDTVMVQGSGDQLRREGGDQLREWFPELDPDERKGFGWNYLTSVDPNRWDPPLLEVFHDRYGAPRKGRTAFWKEVPEEVRKAFHRWWLRNSLEEVLGADSERTDYWMTWVDEIEDAEAGRAGGTKFVVVSFEGFGVVEFLKLGNAAYFYPVDKLEEVTGRSASSPSALKDRMKRLNLGPSRDNRLLHHQGWQRRADRQVRAWIREMGR